MTTTNMDSDLHKLRIDKSQKARKDGGNAWPWIFLVLLLLTGGAFGYVQWQKSHAPVEVETMRVQVSQPAAHADDLVLLNATGYIMAAHRIELASKVVGRVAWVGVEMGDKVQKDQVLVRLEDDEYKARYTQELGQLDAAKARLAELKAGNRPQEIAQAAAQVDAAQVELDKAQRNFTRLDNLKNTSAFSKTELDDANSAVQTAQARLESARQQYELLKAGSRQEQINAQAAVVAQLEGTLQMAKLDLDNTVIRAPVASTILERNVEVGEFVTNGFVGDRGAKGYVVSIADLSDLLVELDISQDNFAKVSYKQPCWVVTDAYKDRKYDGYVELISPVANRQKATIQVRVKVAAPDELLKPDMNATVSFLSPAKVAASQTGTTPAAASKPPIRIPNAAVHEGAVLIVENNKAVRRPVKTGLTDTNGNIEILSGLSGGEDLILHAPATLKDGDSVKLK